jgi:RecB family endonuclease NucS
VPLSVRANPTIEEAAEFLAGAFRSRCFVLMIGNCKVDYEGRASSTLEWGERLTIIKKDGSVLVHRPTGYEPVNWQPPKCTVTISHLEGILTINAFRSQPRESISIEFKQISLTACGDLNDAGEFALHVTEAQMKQAILIAPDLVEHGLRPLEEEKHAGEAGFTDIYAEDKDGSLVVIEIKRKAAAKDALVQLHRYLARIRTRVNRPLRGIVVAPELRKSAQPLLRSLNVEFVRLAPEKCFRVLKMQKDTRISQFIS